MIEEPLKYSKDAKYDSRRIVGLIFIPEEKQPEVGGVTCIIEYSFQEVDDAMHVIDASVYCAYPSMVRNLVDPVVLFDMVRSEIESMEANTQFEFKTVTIL